MAKQEKPDPKKVGVRIKKKITRTVPAGIVQVKATFNNTIISTHLPMGVASVGSPKLLIPIVSSHELFKLKPNFAIIEKWSIENNVNGVYAYARDENDLVFHARGFNPKTGHNEDAATGVAAAVLSMLLKKDIIVKQGRSINQPCSIFVRYLSKESIWVGGLVI